MNSVQLVDPTHAQGDLRLLRDKQELRAALAPSRREGRSIGLVPTMGALHEGHLSLLRAARAECDVVVMSLFVNPAQFGPGEDLDRYPRDEERDVLLAAEAGVDLVYAPPPESVYPAGFSTQVEVEGELTRVLDGEPDRRGPGHFRGVATVVAKLFNVVQPDVAWFGQKDAQQAAVIRRMAADLDFPARIEVLPTVREPDGLAMSSRNAYLGPCAREQATALSRALRRRGPRPRRLPRRRPRRRPCRARRGRGRARVPRGARRRRPFPRHRAGQPAGADSGRRALRWRPPDRQRLDPIGRAAASHLARERGDPCRDRC